MDNLINFETEIPWNMLFTDDEILINQTRKTMNEDLELWRRAFESSGKKISWSNTKVVECKFSVSNSEEVEMVKIENKLGSDNSAA